MTRVVLGSMAFGDTVEVDRAGEILEAALAGGVLEVDTATTYAQGRSEAILGGLLGDAPADVTVSSKVGMQEPETGGPLGASEILRCARLSVERLGRPLETLYLHQPDRSTPLAETVDGLGAVLAEGLARRFATSNHASWQCVELAAAASAAGIEPPRRAQQLYNPLARGLEVEFLPYARERGIEVVVYNPLAGGLLSGRYRSGSVPEEGRFATSALAALYRQRYFSPAHLEVVDTLTALAEEAGMPLAELALRWVLVPGVDAVLLGASRPEQVRANLAAIAAGPLEDELRAAVDRVTEPVRDQAPHYAR